MAAGARRRARRAQQRENRIEERENRIEERENRNGAGATSISSLLSSTSYPLSPIREMIGRYVLGGAQAALYASRLAVKNIDETIPDYAFWDKLRRGKATGYSLGGLFATRIERVFASWVLGGGVEVTLADKKLDETRADYTNGQLADFIQGLLDSGQDNDVDSESDPDRETAQASLLLSVFRDTLGLGDQYLIVNADGSISVPSPETVECKRDPLDYRKIISITIMTKLDSVTLMDEYRADGRTVTVKRYSMTAQTAAAEQRIEYPNLIGRIPVVHVAHGMSANETYGHPIHDALKTLYDQYDDIAFKQLDGARLLGNPIPAFEGLEDLTAVIDANKPATVQTYHDRDGNEVTRPELNIDRNSILLIGKGGTFNFKAPPVGFTEDTKTALKTLFLLLLDHTGIPELIWGNEIASGRSSSETQLDGFERDIRGWQRDTGGWILKLCKIWLAYRALTDPQIIVGKLKLNWPPILEENKEVLLKFIQFVKDQGLVTDETALRLTALVDDPAEEVELAQEEADERKEEMFPEGTTIGFNQRLNGDLANTPEDNGSDDGA